MKSLRIAVALPHLGVYGGIRRFLELGRVWIARGHDVSILTPGSGERPWLPFEGRTGSLEELPSGRWDVLISPDPELFLRSSAPGALRVFYAVLEGAPGAAAAWRSADLLLANSEGMRRHLARRGVSAIAAAGGVNTNFFRPATSDPRRGRLAATGPLKVLVYGRLSRARKGSWTAARAVESAALATGRATELTLFDSPPKEAPEPKLEWELSIPFRWVLRPTQEELRDLYAEADLFVSGERRAGWCNTAAEAMACGAAVVCTTSGTEDFAVDGETAGVTRWPWVWSLARKLAPLLRDDEARRGIAERGRVRISNFTWERTAERIERAMFERLEGGKDAQTHQGA